MRRLIGLAVVAAVAGVGRAEEPGQTITVSASATVYVKPDTARVHYTLRATESSMDAVKDAATKQVKEVNDAVKALKFSSLTTTVGAASFDRTITRTGRPGGFAGPNAGANPMPAATTTTVYYAVVPVTATLHESDADKLVGSVELFVKRVGELGGHVASDAPDNDPFNGPGAFSGRSRLTSEQPRIEWLLGDDSAARKQAYRAAVRKAGANAEAIAEELKWDKLKIVSVVDGASQPRDIAEAAPRAAAGEVAVTARVTIKYSR